MLGEENQNEDRKGENGDKTQEQPESSKMKDKERESQGRKIRREEEITVVRTIMEMEEGQGVLEEKFFI